MTSNQINELQSSLDGTTDAPALLDEILRVKSQHPVTLHDNTRLVALRRRLNHMRAPIERLPDDLLICIFEWGNCSGRFDFSLLVSHVSSRWRTVALQTALLWSRLVIHLGSLIGDKAARLRTILDRSRSAPLDILFAQDEADGLPGAHSSEACQFLHAILSRTRVLELVAFNLHPRQGPHFPTVFSDASLCSLRQLSITLSAFYSLQKFMDVLICCKNLNYLRLEDVFIPFTKMEVEDTCIAHLPSLRELIFRDVRGIGSFPFNIILRHIKAAPSSAFVACQVSDLYAPSNPLINCTFIHSLSLCATFDSLNDPCSLTLFQLLTCMPRLRAVSLRYLYLPQTTTAYTFTEEHELCMIDLTQCKDLGGLKSFVEALHSSFTRRCRPAPMMTLAVFECYEISEDVQTWLDQPLTDLHRVVSSL